MDTHMLAFDLNLLTNMALQLINTAILAFALNKILYKPVKKFLHARRERVSQSLADAKEALDSAYKKKSSYEEKFEGIESERKEILTTARTRAFEIEEQIINEAKARADAIKERATREMVMERKKAEEELRKQIIEISTIIASRYVAEKMDTSTGNRLLNDAIDELGDSAWLN